MINKLGSFLAELTFYISQYKLVAAEDFLKKSHSVMNGFHIILLYFLKIQIVNISDTDHKTPVVGSVLWESIFVRVQTVNPVRKIISPT